MKFITVRDLRTKTAQIRKDIDEREEFVVTANGRPFAMMVRVDSDSVEEYLMAYRRARARLAVQRIQDSSKRQGLDKMTMEEINEIIAQVRRERRAEAEAGAE